jgi:ethanolamine utilization protein EutS
MDTNQGNRPGSGQMRIVQELVAGKEITLAHIIGGPLPIVYQKLGLNPDIDYRTSAIGIMNLTPPESAVIASDIAVKSGNVYLGFADRFSGTLIITGSVSAVESALKALVDYAFKTYEFRQVFFDGQSLEQYPVQGGTSHVVTQAATSVSTVMPLEVEGTQLRWVYTQTANVLNAPVEKGQILGTAQVWYGNKCLAQTEMVAMNAVAVYQAPVVPEKPNKSSDIWLTIILVLLGIILVAGVVFLVLRRVRVGKRKHRKRRSRE